MAKNTKDTCNHGHDPTFWYKGGDKICAGCGEPYHSQESWAKFQKKYNCKEK